MDPAVMKPFGGFVHARRGTVRWPLVGWLCVGSVPSAFLGVLLLRLIGRDNAVQQVIQVALAVALLLAAVGLVVKAYSARRRPAADGAPEAVRVRPLPTALLGYGCARCPPRCWARPAASSWASHRSAPVP